MTESRFPSRSDKYRGKDLGDEYLFYDSSGDSVHVLNGTAREIYLLCDGQNSEEELALALVRTYEIDAETARKDTADALRTMRELGLIKS